MTLITVAKVAEAEGCHRNTVSNWCSKNGIKRWGRDYLLSQEELEAFRNRPTKGRPRNTKVIQM